MRLRIVVEAVTVAEKKGIYRYGMYGVRSLSPVIEHSGVDAGMTLMISQKARGMNLTFLHWP